MTAKVFEHKTHCPPARQVGSVIRNPEVGALVPTLLAAIADPNANTRACLDTLLSTVFVNTVDAPSLVGAAWKIFFEKSFSWLAVRLASLPLAWSNLASSLA